ncbi:MAG: polyprenyl synthetase family protein [Hyphomicrobiaceae bacterium]|nr:polyprenyl synthetase family protein [Hyphomicrobiaceae bacterium]
MLIETRIETALKAALARAKAGAAPPRLADAIDYALFPGGARVRPRLCLAVGRACGAGDDPALDAAAAAIELMHCASLVHDDLPCFDDADLRRGKPSVHRAYGEAIAVLAGDAMIVLAFDNLGVAAGERGALLARLVRVLSGAVGMPHGIIAGQGWESEPKVDLAAYQRAKTGALFMASAQAGAAIAGMEPQAWVSFGMRLGEAYQVADDLSDVLSDINETGKPRGQDDAHGRPSAVREYGLGESVARLKTLMAGAIDAIPDCPGRDALGKHIAGETARFAPRALAQCAA